MWVVERIDHVAADAPPEHEPEVAQNAQLVGDGWLLHLHGSCELPDGTLAFA
ncbi:MAG: hypothetical protein QOI48_452 [Solirubrobacteraceae bacterium]|nr:hypothetical protein [Solirubrobacteraceae bacterium]